jgi:flagellar biogenesis protein FliO
MTTLKHRLAILAALGTLVLILSATGFGQSRRTLIDDSTGESAKTETADTSSKKESNATSASTAETPSNTSAQKPQQIAGSGLTPPQSTTAKSAWPSQATTGNYELFYKPIGATFLICAMAIGFIKVYRKYGRKGAAADAPLASVLASLPLGDKRSLAVVKVGNEVLVLGNTPISITLLTQYKAEPEAVAEVQPVTRPKRQVQPVQPIEDFTRHLKEEMDRKAQNRTSEEPQFARVRQSLLGL